MFHLENYKTHCFPLRHMRHVEGKHRYGECFQALKISCSAHVFKPVCFKPHLLQGLSHMGCVNFLRAAGRSAFLSQCLLCAALFTSISQICKQYYGTPSKPEAEHSFRVYSLVFPEPLASLILCYMHYVHSRVAEDLTLHH